MSIDLLNNAQTAAEIHQEARQWLRTWIKPGLKLFDIAESLEAKVKELANYDEKEPWKAGLAFPTGLSVNSCAAHWTPSFRSNELLKQSDLCKIDFGVHVNGTIIDSAFTVAFDPIYDEFLKIGKEATYTGIKMAGPDQILGEIGEEIQEFIESHEIEIHNKIYPLKSIGELSGHQIDQWQIHSGKAVPNIKIDYNERMLPGEFYAIETFPSTGSGKVRHGLDTSHYMINYYNDLNIKDLPKKERKLFDKIFLERNTLAFCKRWFQREKDEIPDKFFRKLVSKKFIKSYPPLYDTGNGLVVQFEHTLYITEDGKMVLSDC